MVSINQPNWTYKSHLNIFKCVVHARRNAQVPESELRCQHKWHKVLELLDQRQVNVTLYDD